MNTFITKEQDDLITQLLDCEIRQFENNNKIYNYNDEENYNNYNQNNESNNFNNNNDAKIIEDHYYKKILMKYLDYKRKLNGEVMDYREKYSKNNVGYRPDHLSDEIEELSKLLLPFEEIQIYLEMKNIFL